METEDRGTNENWIRNSMLLALSCLHIAFMYTFQQGFFTEAWT